MKSLLSLVLLAGVSSAASLKHKLNQIPNEFAEAMTGTSHTC